MLVLKRRVGERVRIRTPAGDVWVTLIDTDRNTARVGIDAPREFIVMREEILADQPTEPVR